MFDEYQDKASATKHDLSADLRSALKTVAAYKAAADQVEERAAALDEREADLVAREEAVGAAEAAKKANEFGSGTHLVGTDIQPGIYQTAGTSSCYWERLSGLGGGLYDIIANGPSGRRDRRE